MALNKSMLLGMKLEAEQIDAILAGHRESLDAIREESNGYKEEAEKVHKELAKAKSEIEDLKSQAPDDEYKAKYEAEHNAFEAYKVEIANKELLEKTKAAFRGALKDNGVAEKLMDIVLEASDISSFKLGEDGAFTEPEKVNEYIKSKFASAIEVKDTQGANTQTPPPGSNTPPNLEDMTMADYIKARKQM